MSMYILIRVDSSRCAALGGGQFGCDGLVHEQYLMPSGRSCRVGNLPWYAPCHDTRI